MEGGDELGCLLVAKGWSTWQWRPSETEDYKVRTAHWAKCDWWERSSATDGYGSKIGRIGNQKVKEDHSTEGPVIHSCDPMVHLFELT